MDCSSDSLGGRMDKKSLEDAAPPDFSGLRDSHEAP